MDRDLDASGASADDLAELADAVEVWLREMTILRDTLETMQAQRGSAYLNEWAAVTVGIDHLTLRDVLAFDGTIDTVTERMLDAFARIVHARNEQWSMRWK